MVNVAARGGPSSGMLTITGQSSFYRVERTITPATDGERRLLVRDRIINLKPVELGLAFENLVSVLP